MNIENLLNKDVFERDDIIRLLKLENENDINLLYKKADDIRKEVFGDEVHLRGIIEFSNYCRYNCLYCGIRCGNKKIKRYRMSAEEIIESAKQVTKLGVGTIVLQSGEDLYYNKDLLSYIIYIIKQSSDVAITLALGERSFDEYKSWKIAGADRYLLKFETSNPDLYSKIHNGDLLEHRIEHINYLKKTGFQVGSGNMIGLPGQTIEDIADDIILIRDLDMDMAAFGPFVPSPSTPFSEADSGTTDLTLKSMAVLRLVNKKVHIPATTALDTIDEQGREKGLLCGANVVMPNFTPNPYRNYYEIYPTQRRATVDPFSSALALRKRVEALGRKISTRRGDSYRTN